MKKLIIKSFDTNNNEDKIEQIINLDKVIRIRRSEDLLIFETPKSEFTVMINKAFWVGDIGHDGVTFLNKYAEGWYKDRAKLSDIDEDVESYYTKK